MLFLIHYFVKPEHRDTVHERIHKMGTPMPEGVKDIAAYHSVSQLEGWVIVETSSNAQLWNLEQLWTDMNVNTITPVLTNEEMKKLV